jgi:hypothetical protein
MSATDVIAIVAVIIAIVVPSVQTFYERRREWHGSREILIRSIDSLFDEIIALINAPAGTNHLSFQHILYQRKNLLTHYKKRFIFQKTKVEKVISLIDYLIFEIPLITDYEELLNKGLKNKKSQRNKYLHFTNAIHNYTIKATEALIG